MTKKRKTSENNRKFKGVWIPADYWLDENLSIMEVVILTEIDSLDGDNGCFASNKHFASFIGMTPAYVSKIIKHLKEKGYISVNYKTENRVTTRSIKIIRGINSSKRGINNSLDPINYSVPSNTSSNTSSNTDSNTDSNSSSGRRREEDPEREQIYKQFFQLARMHDKMKQKATNPTYDEIKQLRSLLYRCNIDTLKAVVSKFDMKMQWNMVNDPFAYLLKMLRDGLAIDKDSESWGK
ncbi:hypothetical protein HYQ54_1086 [Lactobacillus crispatus]|uniref:helix-turn-helix domain-containing protein n=1 Tax=Lactobacillus crispatus TaxID=47770 RepID=UPI0018E29C83|nr:helix-turn-helix domain-containing protein [Lactobacillus crispatus]MBI1714557.1 hypothetical protein [Lactobacillus crispatus]